MDTFDLAIVFVYIGLVVGIGFYAAYHRSNNSQGEGGHYFLADSSLKWPVIGLAMFAANISTVHLVSLAESAYSHGLVYGNFEWQAAFTLIILGLFFAPVYLKAKLPTVPEFFERRYNRQCRDLMTAISLFSAIVIHIGVALYTAAHVLQGLLGIPDDRLILGMSPTFFFIVVLGVLTGVYTLVGGLLAVVWTESFQTVLLLVGAVTITVVGWKMVGGWENLVHTLQNNPHPLANNPAAKHVNPSTANFLNIMRPAGDPSGLPWYSILLGYHVLAIWYWCTDQTIVQRVLAAKNIRHAQVGPVFCAWLKILPVFFFMLPGVICVALVQQGAFGGAAPVRTSDTYTFMIANLLPVGLKGLVAAALLAAAMQTCSAALNSTATLIAYDFFKVRNPQITDKKLVTIGRVATGVATLVAIGLSPLFGHYTTIIEGLNKLISYAAPPITAVILGGIFTRWATARAAATTLIVGMLAGGVLFALDWFKIFSPDYMLATFVNCLLCFLFLFLVSRAKPEELPKRAHDCIWEGWRWTLHQSSGSLVSMGAAFTVFVVLYVIFW